MPPANRRTSGSSEGGRAFYDEIAQRYVARLGKKGQRLEALAQGLAKDA
jgi:hypothetical protein